MTTLREAINQAIEEHGEESIWGDGGTDWRLDLYIEATEDAERDCDAEESQLDEPAYYDGRTIRLYRKDGTLDTGEALLALQQDVRYEIVTACDEGTNGDESEQFAAWLRAQGHDARVGRTTGHTVNGRSDEWARDIMSDLWDKYCAT